MFNYMISGACHNDVLGDNDNIKFVLIMDYSDGSVDVLNNIFRYTDRVYKILFVQW